MKDDANESTDGLEDTADASPYGPQHGHLDDAAGGADSSPFETMSADERAAALRQARQEHSERPAK